MSLDGVWTSCFLALSVHQAELRPFGQCELFLTVKDCTDAADVLAFESSCCWHGGAGQGFILQGSILLYLLPKVLLCLKVLLILRLDV